MIKKVYVLFVLIIMAILISGCARATYTEPVHVNKTETYYIVIDKSFDTVWKDLISYTASKFFSIENYEKDSGLLILSFNSSKISDFITGGHWVVNSPTGDFDGDYADYLMYYMSGKFTGKVNIVVRKISDKKTSVKINTRYVMYVPPMQNKVASTWIFETGNCATLIKFSDYTLQNEKRTFCPTYKVENSIINAVKN